MDKRNNDSNGEPVVSVKAIKSKSKNALSGRIVVDADNYSKSIPAVIFSPEDAKELLKIAERVYHRDDGC